MFNRALHQLASWKCICFLTLIDCKKILGKENGIEPN